MIDLLIWVLVMALVLGLLIWVIRMLPIPEPFGSVAIAVVCLIFIVMLLSIFVGGLPAPRFR
jgi:hypothetical protein